MKIKEKEFVEGETVYLVFKSAAKDSLSGEYFAMESSRVKEILRLHKLSRIPFLPKYIKGLINLEDEPFCAVDFALFRKLSDTKQDLFLVLNSGGLALQVDDVLDFYGQSEVKRERINDSDDPLFKWRITAGDMISARVLETDVMINTIKEDAKGR